jgi:hypothetical protein
MVVLKKFLNILFLFNGNCDVYSKGTNTCTCNFYFQIIFVCITVVMDFHFHIFAFSHFHISLSAKINFQKKPRLPLNPENTCHLLMNCFSISYHIQKNKVSGFDTIGVRF